MQHINLNMLKYIIDNSHTYIFLVRLGHTEDSYVRIMGKILKSSHFVAQKQYLLVYLLGLGQQLGLQWLLDFPSASLTTGLGVCLAS